MICHNENVVAGDLAALEERRSFLKLPLDERRRRLAAQADQLMEHYLEPAVEQERLARQGGDIVEY